MIGQKNSKEARKGVVFKNVCVALKEAENLTFLRETLLFDDNWCITSISQTKNILYATYTTCNYITN